MDTATKERNTRRVDCTFRVLDAMEDIRDIWRDTAPLQDLDEAQRDKVLKKIGAARKALDQLEGLL
jgi:hypothetical protein